MLERLKRLSVRGRAEFGSKYGSNPAHLILLVIAAVVAGYAVIHWLQAPTPIRLLVWFAAALIGHDLIAAPLYIGVDKLLIRAVAGADPGPVISRWRRAAINHLRFPLFVSVLTFAMWYPLILRRSDAVYFNASGQHEDRYLGNWLIVVAGLFIGSLIIFLVRLALAAGQSRTGASPAQTTPAGSNSAPPEPGTSQP
jgi:hypothetical protein